MKVAKARRVAAKRVSAAIQTAWDIVEASPFRTPEAHAALVALVASEVLAETRHLCTLATDGEAPDV